MQTNSITKFVHLTGIHIHSVRQKESGFLFMAQVKQKKKPICPCCGSSHTQVHDTRLQVVRDIPLYDKPSFIQIPRKRYRCMECAKRFTPALSFVKKGCQLTDRLKRRILESLGQMKTAKAIAEENFVSIMVVQRLQNEFVLGRGKLSSVLCIDEFKGDSGGQKYNAILANGDSHKVIDVLPERTLEHLRQYFLKIPQVERERVQYFVSDMYKPYAELQRLCFPESTYVIDRYHFIRQVIWALENTRKNEQKKMSWKERLFFKRSHSLLLKPSRNLSDAEKIRVSTMLRRNERIRRAYALKESFYRCVLTCENRENAKRMLDRWLRSAQTAGLKEFSDCVRAYTNWKDPILNSFSCSWSNGYVEGTNNKIKALKRICFGMRNFVRFRTRLLCITA